MAEGIYKYRKEKPKKVYTKPQIGFGSVSFASDNKKKYEKPSLRVKPNKEVLEERNTAKHNIDVDLTPAQLSATRKFEGRVHKLKTERVALIDKNGNIISQSTRGTNRRTQLRTTPGKKYPDAIITHNHPDKDGYGAKGLARSIGSSLSGADIRTAIKLNTKGIRAIANGYTFFIGRKGDSYNVSADQIVSDYERLMAQNRARLYAYRDSAKSYEERLRRHSILNTLAGHQTMRELAKKYNLIYTRRKNS